MNEEIVRELQVQSAILRIAFKEQIESLSDELRGDGLASAIIDVLADEGPTASGDLWTGVKALETSAVRRTFVRRLTWLAEIGAVRRVGAGRSTSYELTGLL